MYHITTIFIVVAIFVVFIRPPGALYSRLLITIFVVALQCKDVRVLLCSMLSVL